MNKSNTYSPIDFLKAPVAQTLSSRKRVDGSDTLSSSGSAFSRELSRATERASTTERPSSKTEPRKPDAPSESSKKSLESNRQIAEKGDSEPVRKGDAATGSDTSKSVAEQPIAQTKENSQSSEETRINETTVKQSDVAAGTQEGVSGKDTEVMSATADITSDVLSDVLGSVSGDNTKHPLNNEVGVEHGSEAGVVIELADAGKVRKDGVISSDSQDRDVDVLEALSDTALTDEFTVSAVNVSSSTTRSPGSGEQISMGQLLSRRASLTDTVSTQKMSAMTPAQQSVLQTSVDVEADNLTPRSMLAASINGHSIAALDKEKNIRTGVQVTRTDADESAKSVMTKTLNTRPIVEQSPAGNLLTTNTTNGHLSGQENVAKQMQALAANKSQQKIQQTSLVQARQQAQNLLTAAPVPSAQLTDGASQSADNMFLSLSGGIVTAPVVTRTDTGNNQLINTPINLPILQNDADKSMAGNIKWMVNEGVKNAVVNVTPSGMGPISVSIGIDKEQMNVSIVALQGSTREALDSMLPRLKDQLSLLGQDSVKIDVSDGRSDRSDRGYGERFAGADNASEQDDRSSDTKNNGEESVDSQIAEIEADSRELFDIHGNRAATVSRYDVYV